MHRYRNNKFIRRTTTERDRCVYEINFHQSYSVSEQVSIRLGTNGPCGRYRPSSVACKTIGEKKKISMSEVEEYEAAGAAGRDGLVDQFHPLDEFRVSGKQLENRAFSTVQLRLSFEERTERSPDFWQAWI